MVKLTAVGLRNYIDKTRARRDAREKAVMDIYAKYGSAGLSKIFPMGSGSSNISRTKEQKPTVGFSKIKRDSLNPVFTEQDVSMEEAGYLELLRKAPYNISDETAARLIANGDPTIFKRMYEKAQEKAKYYEGELGAAPPESIISTILEKSAEIPARAGGKLNIDKIESYIGREMDSMMKSIIQSQNISRGQVVLGDTFLTKDLGPEKAKPYIDAAVSYSIMFAQNADKRIKDELQKLTLIAQPKDQNVRGRALTDKELAQQKFLINYGQQLEDATNFYKETDNPIRLFGLYGITGLMAEAERMPRLLNEPLVKQYMGLYGGVAGEDSRMILEIPVFRDEIENVQAVLLDGYKPSQIPPSQQSFLHRLLYGGILHRDQVIQLIAGENFSDETTIGMKLGNPFSKNKRF